MNRQKPLHKYFGINDPDHHSSEQLALIEIKAQVKAITALSSRTFMDEDSSVPSPNTLEAIC